MNKQLFFYVFHTVLLSVIVKISIDSTVYTYFFDEILVRSFLGACTSDRQRYLSLTCNGLFDDICVQANKMSEKEGLLNKAAKNGDIEASIAAIRASEQL